MQFYPFNGPIILTDRIYSEYGGKGTGTFTQVQLQSSYWLAEMQATSYVGTLLTPTIVTGVYPSFAGAQRLITDYGYVHRLLAVTIKSKKNSTTCELRSDDGCGFIYSDTFGYVDWRRLTSVCSCGGYVWPVLGAYYPAEINVPYQLEVAYEAGLPSGTVYQPGILEALTIMAQIDLNEREPGLVGSNEGVGDVGIQKFTSMDYHEERRLSSLKRTNLGDSPKAMRAARLLDMSIKKARRSLRIG